jgi:hypothetical protein
MATIAKPTMYAARITKTDLGFFALVVRIDKDAVEQVDSCYRGRHFASLKAAERSTAKHIAAA